MTSAKQKSVITTVGSMTQGHLKMQPIKSPFTDNPPGWCFPSYLTIVPWTSLKGHRLCRQILTVGLHSERGMQSHGKISVSLG